MVIEHEGLVNTLQYTPHFDPESDDDAAEVCENVSRMKACYSGQRCTKKEESITITLRPQVSVQINKYGAQ